MSQSSTAPASPLDPSAAAAGPPPIPFIDLRAQYLAQRAEIDAAVSQCLAGGWYVLGEQTAAFESEFAAYIGAGQEQVTCVGVNSGTDALHLALRACGIGPGDEVITVAHTAVATAAAIVLAGATPVFVDIDPQSYTLDPDALARAIAPKVKAVIPVHLYGRPAEMAPIVETAHAAGIRVIEDCAQAHGATYRGRAVGLWGDLACFSFYPTKNLGALGDGGAVIGRDPALVEQVRLLREYGWTPQTRYVSQVHGMNSRLDEIQAAVLRVKLRALDAWNTHRRELAAIYAQALPTGVGLPHAPEHIQHVYHLYVIRAPQRDALRSRLQEAGMGTGIHYPVPIHRQPAYAAYRDQPLPVTEQVATEILSLPMHPFLSMADAARVAAAVAHMVADTAVHTAGDTGPKPHSCA